MRLTPVLLGFGAALALSVGGAGATKPAPPPAGLLLFLCSECPSDPGIESNMFTIRTDGRQLRLLARGGDTPRWSPDGRRIVYARGGEEIWTSAADGTKPRRVTRRLGRGLDEGFQDDSPTWFPDGKRLAFVRSFPASHNPERAGRSQLWTVGADGRGPKPIPVRGTPPPGVHEPEVSPDGRRIVFLQSGRGREAELPPLWIANVDGTGRRRVKMPPGVTGEQARWSPDGRQLALVGLTTASSDYAGIRILDLATGRVRRLRGLDSEHGLAWSPDGRWLAMIRHFSYYCPGGTPDGSDTCVDTQIWLVSTTDGRRMRIFRTKSGEIQSGLDWGPAAHS